MAELAISLAGVALNAIVYFLTPRPDSRPQEPQLRLTSSEYGRGIPFVYGRARIEGNYIYPGDIRKAYRRVRRRSGGKGGNQSPAEITIYGTFQIAFCEGEVDFNEVIVNGERVVGGGASEEWSDAYLTFFAGTDDQDPWSIAEAKEGVGNVPAYNGIASIGINELNLTRRYGNQIPQQFAAVVTNREFGYYGALANILLDLCERSGLAPDRIDTSEVSGITVAGFVLNNTGNEYRQAIDQLLLVYQVFVCELPDGTLSFRRWLRPDTEGDWLIPAYYFGSESGNDRLEGRPLFRRTAIDKINLPRRLALRFYDPGLQYARNPSPFAEYFGSDGQDEQIYDTELVMSASDAYTYATRILNQAWLRRYRYNFNLDPVLAADPRLVVGTVIKLPVTGERVQIDQITIGRDFSIEIEAYFYEPSVYTLARTAPETTRPIPVYRSPDPAILYPLDLPFITGLSDTESELGIYMASSEDDTTVFRSTDGNEYESIDSIPVSTAIGALQGTLAGGVVPWLIDEKNSVEVVMSGGGLETITDDSFRRGGQLAFIGRIIDGRYQGEIVCIRDASIVSENRYRISHLLRGLRGTENFIDSHTAGETLILLRGTDAAIERGAIDFSDLNATRFFKGVRNELEDLASLTAYPSLIVGNAYRPFAPANVTLEGRSNGDLFITWRQRPRKGAIWRDFADAPTVESIERYELIINGRSIFVDSPEYLYPLADQISDFGSARTSIALTIYQISSIVGRGFPFTGTVAITVVS